MQCFEIWKSQINLKKEKHKKKEMRKKRQKTKCNKKKKKKNIGVTPSGPAHERTLGGEGRCVTKMVGKISRTWDSSPGVRGGTERLAPLRHL